MWHLVGGGGAQLAQGFFPISSSLPFPPHTGWQEGGQGKEGGSSADHFRRWWHPKADAAICLCSRESRAGGRAQGRDALLMAIYSGPHNCILWGVGLWDQ